MALESGNDFKTGKIYYGIFRLTEVTDKYKYYFEAKDTMGILAIGSPTLEHSGPKVKEKQPQTPQINQTLEYLSIFCYPNPHTGKTTICVETNLIGVDVNMYVKIYNLVGELIWEGRKDILSDSGIARFDWDGRDVASGIYLYKVTVTYKDKTMEKMSKMGITR